MSQYLTKEFTVEHLEPVLAIEHTCFSTPWVDISFQEIINNNHSFGLVAAHEKHLDGYIVIDKVVDEAEILKLAVLPHARRGGCARQLVDHAIGLLRRDEVRCIFLEVRESNIEAIALYTALGFKTKGMRKGYYSHPPEHALIMKLEL
jgi:ribosomal-protein-alanine acetyltransferase